MLLKFTAPDMLNTSLIDVATGERAYDIVTVLIEPTNALPQEESSSSSTPASSSRSPAMASSSKSPTPTVASSSPSIHKRLPQPSNSKDTPKGETRRTTVTDATGTLLADITWNGRRPNIIIGDENIGALTDLFGSSTIRFMPKILAIPTRFDTEYIWTATADSLTLFDYDTETAKGSFHQNVIRIPTGSKTLKSKLSSPSQFILTSSSMAFSCPSEVSECETKTVKSAFIPTHLPGVGSNYLEFTSHPLAHDVEIIFSFLMMEILRRGRFSLTPYTFEKPKLWQLKEARDLFLRRLRRNTV